MLSIFYIMENFGARRDLMLINMKSVTKIVHGVNQNQGWSVDNHLT